MLLTSNDAFESFNDLFCISEDYRSKLTDHALGVAIDARSVFIDGFGYEEIKFHQKRISLKVRRGFHLKLQEGVQSSRG